MEVNVAFASTLFSMPGKGGWTFAPVPEEHAPLRAGPWGRTAVTASVDDHTWAASVWRDKSGRTLLPVPKDIRRGKGDGDVVQVRLRYAAF